KPWVVPDLDRDNSAAGATLWDSWVVDAPLAGALSLVLLACWGVVLVTRGRIRRGIALLALLAAVGLVASVIWAGIDGPQALRDNLADPGAQALLGDHDVDAAFTGWYWTAAVTAPVSVVAALLAVRFAPQWPEMGSRYDAPTAAGGG